MARLHRVTTGGALLAALAMATPAVWAQDAERKWELEVHAGAATSTTSSGGSIGGLPTGATFTTLAGAQRRRESTWFCGSGAALLNSVNTVLAPSTRITPLDGIIGAAAIARDSGAAAGVRLTRRFGARYSAEFNVDYARTPLRFTQGARDGIEASRATFVSAVRGLFVSGPSANPTVTANATFTEGAEYELLTTGVFGVDLLTRGRFIPYVVGGGGLAHNGGDGPTAALVGNYGFTVFAPAAINETDRVTIRVDAPGNAPVAVFGGGFRYAASARWGIRGDVRFLAGAAKHDVLVDASPSTTTSSPAVILISPTNPSAVFSSSPAITSSLTGPPISALRTFQGSGSSVRTNVTAGFYLRF